MSTLIILSGNDLIHSAGGDNDYYILFTSWKATMLNLNIMTGQIYKDYTHPYSQWRKL